MLALIGIANLANLSLLSPAIPGPECYLAGRPLLVVTVVFGQIVVTLIGVGVLARQTSNRRPGGLLSSGKFDSALCKHKSAPFRSTF